jgi:hypothetical protein
MTGAGIDPFSRKDAHPALSSDLIALPLAATLCS